MATAIVCGGTLHLSTAERRPMLRGSLWLSLFFLALLILLLVLLIFHSPP